MNTWWHRPALPEFKLYPTKGKQQSRMTSGNRSISPFFCIRRLICERIPRTFLNLGHILRGQISEAEFQICSLCFIDTITSRSPSPYKLIMWIKDRFVCYPNSRYHCPDLARTYSMILTSKGSSLSKTFLSTSTSIIPFNYPPHSPQYGPIPHDPPTAHHPNQLSQYPAVARLFWPPST